MATEDIFQVASMSTGTTTATEDIFQVAWGFASYMQMEIVIFAVAILAHVMFFGRPGVQVLAKGKQARRTKADNSGESAGKASSPKYSSQAAVDRVRDRRPSSSDAASSPAASSAAAAAAVSCASAAASTSAHAAGNTGSRRRARAETTGGLLQATPTSARQAALIKRLGAERKLEEAFAVFRACSDKPSCLYNTLLDACVECRDPTAAESVLAEAEAAASADAVTYNTVLKARLQFGSLSKAQETISAMRTAGHQPNCVTFNQLLDATIHADSRDLRATWRLVENMEACGLKPNHITASILLKTMQPGARAADVERTMAIVDKMGDTMDEVLLSSVVEACVRTDRTDLLAAQLKKRGEAHEISLSSAQTYGSVIRAYGVMQDVPAAWAAWKKMHTNGIMPTSITLGCMVEALATNGQLEAAHSLIRETIAAKDTRSLVNAVIYCSILKGFSHEKRFDRVWEIYQEMQAEGLKPSVTVFNALIDACARCGRMNKVSKVLEDMGHAHCEPNLVTYSSVAKGYCLDKQLDKALEILKYMKEAKGFCPDEITWNTLLDGCARQGLYDKGKAIFNDMLASGVPPSNFTLSVLVKLVSRGRRLEEAFELCDSISKRFRFKLNSFVYNNLVQACVSSKDLPRAVRTFETMLRERCRPDSRTYMLLLQGHSAVGKAREGAGLLAGVCGLRQDVHPCMAGVPESLLRPKNGLPSDAVSEVLSSLAKSSDDLELAARLFSELRRMPGLHLDRSLSTKLACQAVRRGTSAGGA